MRPGERGAARIVIAVLVGLLVAGGGAALWGRSALQAPSATHDQPVSIQVTAGETLDQVTDDLTAHSIIRSRFWFSLYARFKGLGSNLHQGTFLVDSGMGASAVIAKLEGTPDVSTVTLVLTEGMTAQQMAATVANSGLPITAAEYAALASHPTGFSGAFLKGLPANAPLEGFLFPDTYNVPANATAHDLIQMQLDDFQQKAVPLLTSKTLNAYQTITVASLIEREAKFDSDRTLVSGVIANRLAQGMALQLDASVLYGIGVTGRSPTPTEMQQDTPYNSYLHTGLPPTPIANPGASAIAAAATPAQTPYLFYVSDCAGHNHYSVGADEHQQQINQYLASPCGVS